MAKFKNLIPKLICVLLVLVLFALAGCNVSAKNDSSDKNQDDLSASGSSDSGGDDEGIDGGTDEDHVLTATMQKMTFQYDEENLNYWLYTPTEKTEGMPLIVYLHGGSCKGDDPDTKITIFDSATHFDVPELAYLGDDIGIIDWLIGK